MANVKISELPSATALTLASIYPVVQGGVTKQITASLFLTALSPEMFGATGGSDDTTAFQGAMDAAASSGGGVVVGKPGRTYTVSTLTPRENVLLSLYGCTMKMKDNVEEPMFYEVTTKSTYFRNFHIQGGSFNLNKANNHTTNHSGGFVWLTNWQECSFRNLTITNAFKDIFLPAGCEDFVYENITADSCGQNSGGFYCYGISLSVDSSSNPCRRFSVRNFKVKNHFGYGIHWFKAEDCSAENILFDTFTQGGLAIGVTWTQAARISMKNIKCNSIDGPSLECNASTDITLENALVTSSGGRSISFGDNGTGISNERVTVRNFKCTATGAADSMNIDYLKKGSFQGCEWDKSFAFTAGTVQEPVRFIDCTWPSVSFFSLATVYDKIFHFNSVFSDLTLQRVEKNCIEIALPPQQVNNAAAIYMDFTNFQTLVGPGNGLGGVLTVLTSSTGAYNQGSFQSVPFYSYGATTNIGTPTNTDGSTGRQMTIAADAANKRISLTNGTGINLYVRALATIL